jgi:hypothetical protein
MNYHQSYDYLTSIIISQLKAVTSHPKVEGLVVRGCADHRPLWMHCDATNDAAMARQFRHDPLLRQ